MARESENSGPEKRFKCYGVEASIWRHEKGYSITIKKQYKTKEGDWEDTNTFFADELPRLALVAMEAYKFILLME